LRTCRRIFSVRRGQHIKHGSKTRINPSLQFKQIHTRQLIYSVRVGIGWRAVGVKDGETVIWFWIGSHAEYDNLLTQL
jgi:hypothetical protein